MLAQCIGTCDHSVLNNSVHNCQTSNYSVSFTISTVSLQSWSHSTTCTMSRLAIIAILTAVVFLLGNLWMSLTTYSYAKIHLFILAPAAFLYFVPPRPLSKAHPGVRRFGYTIMILLAVIALTYSVAGWDHLVFENGVISLSSSFGSFYDVPYEECLTCIDYTLLISLWVMSIWRSRPVSQIHGDPCVGFRAASTLVCLAIAYYGYILQGQGKNMFYLGMTIQYLFPILALLFAVSGHLYLECLRECVLGVIVPSLYVIAIDTFAIYKGIWQVSDKFSSGKYVFGINVDNIIVFAMITALVSLPIVGFLRHAEIYQVGRKKTGSALKAWALIYVWG